MLKRHYWRRKKWQRKKKTVIKFLRVTFVPKIMLLSEKRSAPTISRQLEGKERWRGAVERTLQEHDTTSGHLPSATDAQGWSERTEGCGWWNGGVGEFGASLTGAVITEEINSTPSNAISIHSLTPSPFRLSSLFQNTSRETLVACTAGPQKGQPQTCLTTSSTSYQPLWFPSSLPSSLSPIKKEKKASQ